LDAAVGAALQQIGVAGRRGWRGVCGDGSAGFAGAEKRTPSQGRMGWSKRRRNVQGAFKVNPAWRQNLTDRRILLIDDVLTTGATAQACAKTLLKGGATAVDVLTLARVVRAAD